MGTGRRVSRRPANAVQTSDREGSQRQPVGEKVTVSLVCSDTIQING